MALAGSMGRSSIHRSHPNGIVDLHAASLSLSRALCLAHRMPSGRAPSRCGSGALSVQQSPHESGNFVIDIDLRLQISSRQQSNQMPLACDILAMRRVYCISTAFPTIRVGVNDVPTFRHGG
jgi:hypothetical protein